jgi:hypothetical protein
MHSNTSTHAHAPDAAEAVKAPNVVSPFEHDPFVADYEASAAARAALEPAQLVMMNIDVQELVPAVLASAHRISSLRPTIVEQLPQFDIARFDMLPSLAQSLAYAHSLFLSASTTPQTLPQLAERAIELREMLLLDVTGLTKRGLIAGAPLSDLKGVVGYANVSSDLRVLTNIYQANWPVVVGKTAVQLTELNEAALLFRQMTSGVAERHQQSVVLATASDQRQRAYTLVVRAYEDARRAVTYVRSAAGDAEKLAPSLWKGRGGRRGGADGTDHGGPLADTPQPLAVHSRPDASVAMDAVGNAHSKSAAPGGAREVIEAGMPGGSPFIDG